MCKKLVIFSCCFVFLQLVPSGGAYAQQANLVGWWKLDDMAGNIAADSSGNELNGTLSEPNSPEWTTGYKGGSLFFELGEYVDLGNPSLLDFGTGGFSLMAWINTVSSGQGEDYVCPIICKGGDWTGGIRYAVTMSDYSDGTVNVVLDDDVTKIVLTGTVIVNDGVWHHVAVTKEQTTLSLYIDGVKDGNNPGDIIPEGYDLSGTSQHNAYIGTIIDHRDDLPHKFYRDGRIDDVRIFNVALSEDEIGAVVAFNMRGDPALAWKPGPIDGETEASLDAALSWKAGDGAVTHDVYFGTDFNSVNDANTANTLDVLVGPNQAQLSYTPDSLEYGQTYYWRVDELSDSGVIKGDVWSFTVLNYPIVIEDFENYGDYPPDEVWMVWLDGYENPMNGSSAGYPDPEFVYGVHYLEDTFVHSGDWSMPLFYDNLDVISEVTRTLTPPMSDMTREGVVTLTLFYLGDVENSAEPMYVALDDAVVYNDDADAALVTEWTRWDIPLQEFAGQGVNLGNVGSITIGFGNRDNPTAGGSGHVFFDDIRLYRP
jgi:hypothetical protein